MTCYSNGYIKDVAYSFGKVETNLLTGKCQQQKRLLFEHWKNGNVKEISFSRNPIYGMKIITQTWDQSANLQQIICISSDNICKLLQYLKCIANQFSKKIGI